jgi:hypothetical protein
MGRRNPKTFAHLAFRPTLDRIDARLLTAFPEDEMEKINKAMLLLFGPEPDRFVVPEKYRYLDDEP